MKIIFYIILMLISFNATAESFTERVSAKYNANVDKVKADVASKVSAEQKVADSQCYNHNNSKIVQWFLLIIAIMLIVIYVQKKKIAKLSHHADHH